MNININGFWMKETSNALKIAQEKNDGPFQVLLDKFHAEWQLHLDMGAGGGRGRSMLFTWLSFQVCFQISWLKAGFHGGSVPELLHVYLLPQILVLLYVVDGEHRTFGNIFLWHLPYHRTPMHSSLKMTQKLPLYHNVTIHQSSHKFIGSNDLLECLLAGLLEVWHNSSRVLTFSNFLDLYIVIRR